MAAASKYASALHGRTHRVTSALAYAALEWTLIALLLINGLLSHAVARFAAYFGLNPPCLLCSRVDRLFGDGDDDDEAAGDTRWLRGLLCGAHAAEISGMGYCLHHRRLVAEADDMCDRCQSSWNKETRDGGAEETTVCSCCKVLLEKIHSRATHPREGPPAVHDKTAGEEENEEDQGYVLLDQEDHEEVEQAEVQHQDLDVDAMFSGYVLGLCSRFALEQQNEEGAREQQGEIEVSAVEDRSFEVMAQGEEITREDDRLVPVVALDEMTIADDSGWHSDAGEGDGDMNRIHDESDSDDLDTAVVLEEKRMLASSVAAATDITENSVPRDDELVLEDTTAEIGDFRTEEDIAVPHVPEDGSRSAEVETNCEVSIGSDICEQEQDGHGVPFQELVALEELFSPLEYADDRTLPLETLHDTAATAEQESSETEQRLDYQSNGQNDEHEDKAPGTPTYSFTSQNSGKRFLLEQQGEIEASAVDDRSLVVMAQGEEIMRDNDRLVPVVALDEMTVADDSGWHSDAGEGMNRIHDESDPDYLDAAVVLEEKRMLASSVATASAITENSVPRDNELVLEDTTVEIGDFRTEEEEDIAVPHVTESVPEDGNKSADAETNCEVSIGSDICEQEQYGHGVPFQELVALEELFSPLEYADDRTLPLETLHDTATAEQESSETEQRLDYAPNDVNEEHEDKAPGTPTYSFTSQNSGKRFLLERKLSLSLSMDGSVSSEIEFGEPPTIDQLKSMLQTERKTLSAMYAELEEERNAAAIATNQTMAMINRLQEEKAAMQMEALQYQRMMEEQSEYDQEAMQLLTELVTKREREKQELEREMELCRQKLLHYEDKERRRMSTFKDNAHSSNGSGTSVSSSGEDCDEHSDDDCELGVSPSGSGNLSPGSDQENSGHLVALDDSLTYFEMERLSILDELKTLEERLFTLEDGDINDTNVAPDRSSDDYELSADGAHSPENGLTNNKAKFEGRSSVSRGKSLLPLFDAVGEENCDRASSAEADDSTKPVAVFAKEQERLAIIEEVDHVYERLQALEADKEFLRHCIKSLKTGDKGMYLLQEILQHLRELRNVELHVKNAGGTIPAN